MKLLYKNDGNPTLMDGKEVQFTDVAAPQNKETEKGGAPTAAPRKAEYK